MDADYECEWCGKVWSNEASADTCCDDTLGYD